MKWKFMVVGLPFLRDSCLEKAAFHLGPVIRAPTVKSMVDQALAKVNADNGDTILSLDIWDHASPDLFHLGLDTVYFPKNPSVVRRIDWVPITKAHLRELARLKDYMTEETEVRFHGCQLGRAKQFLKVLSKWLGNVEVSAGVKKQPCLVQDTTFFGPVRRCTGNICTYTGKTLFDLMADVISPATFENWTDYN